MRSAGTDGLRRRSSDTSPGPVVILKSGRAPHGFSTDPSQHAHGNDGLAGSYSDPNDDAKTHMTSDQALSILWRGVILTAWMLAWVILSSLDAAYTPRDPSFQVPWTVLVAYQWCFVGYVSNMILTLIKVIFEVQPDKIKLHMVSCYINFVAAGSYAMLWTGFSPISPDLGSCLFIPQRWLLYIFTVPAIFYILGRISNYSRRRKLWIDVLNIHIMISGGMGTIPWLKMRYKIMWYIVATAPFPGLLHNMWMMMSVAVNEIPVASRAGIKFVRLFTVLLYCTFPIMYFGSILGVFRMELLEPIWAALDWLIKMVYSSSLMETNFFVAQRRESVLRAIEEANKLRTIQALSSAIERKDNFLSAMSHELRTPLNGIIGLSESLESGSAGQLPEKALQVMASVKHSGKRLLQLINDILDAAKMNQGKLIIKRETVDMKLLVSDVLDISAMLVRKGVKLINNVGHVPLINGDTDRIVQILYNLVGNAAKFTKQGYIQVSAGVSADRQRLFVAVSDSGCGVPKDKIGKIFGAFEQADMSTTRHYGGTGLGLHLVKELVKAHSGDITVESQVDRGSTFTVWLPINSSEEAREEEPGAGIISSDDVNASAPRALDNLSWQGEEQLPRQAGRSSRSDPFILSVDDDRINQMVVENLLTPAGFKVEQVMDGMEALRFLSEAGQLPDVVLLDVMMPGMDGYVCCKEIRKMYSAVQLPIVMVSAKSSPEDVMEGLRAGANDYVKKPFHRQELLTRIHTQIKQREAFKQEIQTMMH